MLPWAEGPWPEVAPECLEQDALGPEEHQPRGFADGGGESCKGVCFLAVHWAVQDELQERLALRLPLASIVPMAALHFWTMDPFLSMDQCFYCLPIAHCAHCCWLQTEALQVEGSWPAWPEGPWPAAPSHQAPATSRRLVPNALANLRKVQAVHCHY